jgi:YHS domain-containing protein
MGERGRVIRVVREGGGATISVAADVGRRRRGQMTTDPVCGMEIEEGASAAEVEQDGTRYYFCSESCKEEFLSEPARYVGVDQPGASP